MTDPFISFVVPTLDNADLAPRLVETAKLLAEFPCEFCISDGGSRDNTLSQFENIKNIRIIRSGPDQGIYDAWNRVIPACRGEYIAFIGIDDEPQLPFLCAAKKRFEAGSMPGVIYGDARFRSGSRYQSAMYPKTPSLFEDDRPEFDIAHVGALNHRSLFLSHKFDSTYRLAGDLEFYLRIRYLIREKGYLHIPLIQAIIDANGVSRNPRSVTLYLNEFARIKQALEIHLDYPYIRLRILSLIGGWPWLYKKLKAITWLMKRGRNV